MPNTALVHPRVLSCPGCGIGLGAESLAASGESVCPSCGQHFAARLFPQFYLEPAGAVPVVARATDGEASCFFHPENRAAVSCDRCGRFMCAVCEIRVGARKVCPQCLSLGLTDPKKADFVAWRFIWGNAALVMGVVPLIGGLGIWPMLILTAPTAIVLALWGWRKPGSLVRGPRHGAAVIGIICAVLQLAFLTGLVLLISGAILR